MCLKLDKFKDMFQLVIISDKNINERRAHIEFPLQESLQVRSDDPQATIPQANKEGNEVERAFRNAAAEISAAKA